MTIKNISYHYIHCMEFMSKVPDKFYDIGIVDPNWGREQHGGISRSHAVEQTNGNKLFVNAVQHKKKDWDSEPVSAIYLNELIRVTKHQIIFGINYFKHDVGPGRIIWDKCNLGLFPF